MTGDEPEVVRPRDSDPAIDDDDDFLLQTTLSNCWIVIVLLGVVSYRHVLSEARSAVAATAYVLCALRTLNRGDPY